MKSSSQKQRQTKISQSYEHIGIEHLLSSDRSPHKSMMYDKIAPHFNDHSPSKKNKFLIELPKIYPIHKKLLNVKMKELESHQNSKFNNERRFHLRGIKFLYDIENRMEHHDNIDQSTTIQTANDDYMQRSRLSTKKKESSGIILAKSTNICIPSASLWNELMLRINYIKEFLPLKNAKIKAFVEEGNNSRLIKELLRKRVQIKLVDQKAQADIVWTRFADYNAVEKYCKYTIADRTTQKQKSVGYFERSEQDFAEAYRRISSQVPSIESHPLLPSSQYHPSQTSKRSSYPAQNYQKKTIQMVSLFMHNHLKNHEQISDKKNLFKNIRSYCKLNNINEATIIPKTYHVDCLKLKEEQLERVVGEILCGGRKEDKNSGCWKGNVVVDESNSAVENHVNDMQDSIGGNDPFFVVKPGEDTNRGEGITVVRGKQAIIQAIKQLHTKGKTSLVQQYINPLLYRNRKFDIRCYVLVTSIAGQLHAYWYKEGYLRTCVKQFTYDANNIFGHLTNDAVQKKHKDYGKFQQANKLSFNDLEMILTQTEKTRDEVIRDMKELARHSIKAVEQKLRGEKNVFGFEIFGYDFLIDGEGKVWLIEVNTNPCLEFSGSLLSRIIWHMVDNSIRIAVDPFLDPDSRKEYQNYLDVNKYQLII